MVRFGRSGGSSWDRPGYRPQTNYPAQVIPKEIVEQLKKRISETDERIIKPGSRIVIVSPYEVVNKEAAEKLAQMADKVQVDFLNKCLHENYPFVNVAEREREYGGQLPALVLDFERVLKNVSPGTVRVAQESSPNARYTTQLIEFDGYGKWASEHPGVPYFRVRDSVQRGIEKQLRFDKEGNFDVKSVILDKANLYGDLAAINQGMKRNLKIFVRP